MRRDAGPALAATAREVHGEGPEMRAGLGTTRIGGRVGGRVDRRIDRGIGGRVACRRRQTRWGQARRGPLVLWRHALEAPHGRGMREGAPAL